MRRNNPFRTAAALAAATALLGACSESSADTDDKADESPSSSPTSEGSTPSEETSTPIEEDPLPDGVLALPPEAGTSEAILDAGRYHVPLSDTLAFEVDLPQDTEANSGGLYLWTDDDIVLKVEVAGEAYGVPRGPCSGISPAGPTVDNLVTAIRNQPIYRVSRPEPVQIDGAAGKLIEVRIPAGYDATSCSDGQVGLPGNPDTSNDTPPGYVGDWWILDVDGQRVVARTFCDNCDGDTRDRTTTTVRSITFIPTT